MKRAIFAAAIGLAGCNMNPKADQPIAVGPWAQIKLADEAARQCGAVTRFDPLDDARAVLLIVPNGAAGDCALQWIRKNAPQSELTPAKRKEIGLS